tara:strand:- start:346 stop:720 length:375 start_codon:yes stop_codon:yes gene_type:complete
MQFDTTKLVRIFLGALLIIFGLNGFFGFIPLPTHGGEAGAFLGALAATGYMFPLIKFVEVLGGVLLLTNRRVSLALAMIVPVLVNIMAFHAFLSADGVFIPLLMTAATVYLIHARRETYASMVS